MGGVLTPRRAAGVAVLAVVVSLLAAPRASLPATEPRAASSPPLAFPTRELPVMPWVREFGTSENETGYAIAVTDTGVFVAGFTDGALPGQVASGMDDAFVRRYDLQGNEVWTRQFGSAEEDFAMAVAADASGTYVAGGTWGALPDQTSTGAVDAFIRKYDPDGNEMWTRQFGSIASEVRGIAVVGVDLYAAGVTFVTPPNGSFSNPPDAYVAKFDLEGNVVWTRQFGTLTDDAAFALAATESGAYAAGATRGSLGGANAGGLDAFVRMYDPDGNAMWTTQFGSPVSDEARGIAADTSGVYVTGYALGPLPGQTSLGGSDAFVRAFSPSGAERWTRQFGTPGSDLGYGIATNATGVYAVGLTDRAFPNQTSAGTVDAFVQKFDAAGNDVWTRQAGGPAYDAALGIAAGPESMFVAGDSYGAFLSQPFAGRTDVVVAEVSSVFWIPRIETRPVVLDFGAVPVGSPVTADIEIRSVGNDNLTIAAAFLVGGGGSFSIGFVPGTPFVLPPGASALVTIAFSPGAPGPAADVFRIQSDDPDRALADVPLRGVGMGPDLAAMGPAPPSGVTTGMALPLVLSIEVANLGMAGAGPTELTFANGSTPASPFARSPVSALAAGGSEGPFTTVWTAPAAPGTYQVTATVDPGDTEREMNESNNAFTWSITVVGAPVTALVVGSPNYASEATYITSLTPLSFDVSDPGATGILRTAYRVDGGGWTDDLAGVGFTIPGEGEHRLEWFSTDRAGNVETVRWALLRVDDTPPDTTLDSGAGSLTPDARIALAAADSGSGVARTEYRIDDDAWVPYTGPFTVPVGEHRVRYRSVDNLGNTEIERARDVSVADVERPPPTNWKPVIAAVFAALIALAGAVAARRASRGDRRVATRVFAVASLPFVLMESATGIASFATGILTIPPLLGVGTAVDGGILAAGLVAAGVASRRLTRGARSRTRSSR